MPDHDAHALGVHGARRLPSVDVDSYNLEIKDEGGFLGDRASKGAFREILEKWRKPLRKQGDDPFGDEPTEAIAKKKLDTLLAEGHPDAAGALQGAIEDFAQELAYVIRQFLKRKDWRDTEKIVVGGGFREARFGELAIARAGVILKAEDVAIDLVAIRHHPDEAALIGATELAPSWLFKGHDAILAVDIGGTNIRAGVVELNLKNSGKPADPAVWRLELWRYADAKKISREEAVAGIVDMLNGLIARAKKSGVGLAPFVGIGCPGRIDEAGSIERGAQNLPGNWESRNFHLPTAVREAIPAIAGHDTVVLMHNDAVLQGLSEAPHMQDIERWGVLTIGTGLGNARFTNRDKKKKKAK